MTSKLRSMRVGVFDSGLGGLFVAKAIEHRLPDYDYLYVGDTMRVPYGSRSQRTIHKFVSQALDYLYQNDCELIILACNTASAESLRKSQREYLPAHYPDRRVLGVVIPTAEAAVEALGSASPGRVGVLATASTVESGAFPRELDRCKPGTLVFQQAAPLLVPLVENDGLRYVDPILDDYLAPLLRERVECIILGCTHYAALKDKVRERVSVPVISADEVVPDKLADYLCRHPEVELKLSKAGSRRYEVTDLTDSYLAMAKRFAGADIDLVETSLG